MSSQNRVFVVRADENYTSRIAHLAPQKKIGIPQKIQHPVSKMR